MIPSLIPMLVFLIPSTGSMTSTLLTSMSRRLSAAGLLVASIPSRIVFPQPPRISSP